MAYSDYSSRGRSAVDSDPYAYPSQRAPPRPYRGGGSSRGEPTPNYARSAAGDPPPRRPIGRPVRPVERPIRPDAGYARPDARPARSEAGYGTPSRRVGRSRDEEYAASDYGDRRRPPPSLRPERPDFPSPRRNPPPPSRRVKPEYDDYDDYDQPTEEPEVEAPETNPSKWGWESLKKTVWGEEKQQAQKSAETPEAQPDDQSNTIWAKLATVTTTIQKRIVGVDEGYESDATDYDGDSHLIRIMKEYYANNAESARDLPTWLFSKEEINFADSARRLANNPESEPRGTPRAPRGEDRPRPGALADIYNSVPEPAHQRHQRGYPKSPRNNTSFDSGYASGPSPPPNRRKYGRDEQFETPAPVGRNRLARNPITPPSSQTSRARPRERRVDSDDYGGDHDDYSAPRSQRGGSERDYGGREDASPPRSRARPAARPEPSFYDEPPRGYPPRGYRR
ncbi:uncharacterized protein MELLADRAFT_93050 [Melampsora larici-populina 98AG31]|uniref:Mso1 N-terminal domain-containing protein n=1 Tax=Melampsora larici-populina (strain 98AG31 / pathotype 3-4-7) TaxID=747676 RepID=F4S3R3_MELLP|nr:uncharacterized protein MELLADRAFT_93050 [Melampsora larici-populina 98AG31]EGG00719.1 hypothetical protein MELLADRAFT_93050 [Melampsora larici-populina 98AG31]